MPYDDVMRKHAARLLLSWKQPVLISHAKPDGDAIGSLLATRSLLAAQGLQPTALLFEALPSRYAFLANSNFEIGDENQAAPVLSHADAVVILDTCSYSQLEPVAGWLKNSTLPILVIDHHGTRDPITSQMLIDESAAATCLIIYELALSAGWIIDQKTALAMFVGISTDTGWFRHSNTDARAIHAAADLLTRGVKAHEVYEALYHQDSPARVRLLAEALSTLQIHAAGRLAIMTLPRSAFDRAHATSVDTEDIVNEPLRIASAIVSVLLVEQPDGQIRLNFRSKAPDAAGARPLIDVAAIAGQFGGGGHRHAAGARVRENLESIKNKILELLARELDRSHP